MGIDDVVGIDDVGAPGRRQQASNRRGVHRSSGTTSVVGWRTSRLRRCAKGAAWWRHGGGRMIDHTMWVYPGRGSIAVNVIHAGTDWPAWITAFATAALALGALVALFQLREARRTRHTEAAARMSSRWESPEYTDARRQIDAFEDTMALRDAVVRAMSDRKSDNRYVYLRELSFLEELGAMEKLGAISLRWIDETMRDLVLDRWELWQPTIAELRKDLPQESGIYKNFELLTKKLMGERLPTRRRLSRWLVRQLSY